MRTAFSALPHHRPRQILAILLMTVLAILATMLSPASASAAGPSFDPGNFQFGTRDYNRAGQVYEVMVTNTGDVEVDVQSATLSSQNGKQLLLEYALGTYEPGQSRKARLEESSFSNDRFGPLSVTLTVKTSIGEYKVPVTANYVWSRPFITDEDGNQSVDFGEVAYGTEATKTLTLANLGTGHLTSASLDPDDSEYTATGLDQLDLAPGTSVQFQLHVIPRTVNARSSRLTFVFGSNSIDPEQIIEPSRTGIGPELTIAPNPVTLADVRSGGTATAVVTLTNSGNRPLTLGPASLPSVVGPGTFALSGVTTGRVLSPGATTTVSITYTAAGRGAATTTVQVKSDDPETSIREVDVSARSVAPVTSAAPSPLAFGDVRIGRTSTRTLTLSNTGDAPLGISRTSVIGPSYAIADPAPASIAPGASATVTVSFTPTTLGAAPAQVQFTTDDPSGSVITVPVTGRGTQAILTAPPLSFGTVDGGSAPVTGQLQLGNSGNIPLNVTAITDPAGDDFDVLTPALPITIAAGATVPVPVRFSPNHRGTQNAVISLASDAGAPLSVALSGTVVSPLADFAPASVAFGDTEVGTSASRSVTVTNTGERPLTFGTLSASTTPGTPGAGDFTYTGDTSPLAPNATRTLTVTFTPSVTGARAATLSANTNSFPAAPAIPVTGQGVAAVAVVQPSAVAFGSQRVASSATKPVTVTNTGTAPLRFSSVAVTGAPAFSVTGSTADLAPGAVRTLTVTFAPGARGDVTGVLRIASNSAGSPVSVPLSGTGIAPVPAVSPTAADFGSVGRGASSSRTVTVTNQGDAPLTFGPVTVTGTDAARFTTAGDTTPLAPGGSRVFTVTFTPNATGPRTAALNIAADGLTAIAPVALTGTGTAPGWSLAIDPAATTLFKQLGTTIVPIAPASGTGPITFPISAGTVDATGAGTISSLGGLQFKRLLLSSNWTNVAVDLKRRTITAQTGLPGVRTDVATLTGVTVSPGLGDTLRITATVSLTGPGAVLLNAITLNPLALFSGYRLGTITMDAPRS